MSAPLVFFTGAPVAQFSCATAPSALKGKPSGAKRATAALPVAQEEQMYPVICSGRMTKQFD